MIHISIPTTQTLVETDGNLALLVANVVVAIIDVGYYGAFDIHINGAYHASIRYSHLLKLHEKLRSHFGPKLKTPDFPSKKLFRILDQRTLEERRLALARYFQTIVQLQSVAQHFITENAFLNFQIESFRPSSSNVSVDVFMADGSKETVRCNVEHPTEIILKRFADIVGLGFENVGYFGLFVAKRRHASDDGHFISSLGSMKYPDTLSVRLLRNFESPYLSIHLLNQKSAATGVFYYIVIRKLIWDPKVEEEIMDDPGAVLLLYKQAANDLHNGHFVPRQIEIKNRLMALEEQGNCIQFLRLCHLEPDYSYEVLEPCSSNYPKPGTECNLKIGRRHIVLEFKDQAKDGIVRAEFRATRIRVWRISQQNNGFTFLFEYLISKGVFHWITLHTNQAILLSLLLQSIGLEILKEHRSLMTTIGNHDYDYPTKDIFKIYSSQEVDVSIGPPFVSRGIQYSTSIENSECTNSVQSRTVEESIISNHDSLGNGRSYNSTIPSVNVNNHYDVIIQRQNSESVAGDSKEFMRDAFTTISKVLPLKSEGFEITDDDL
ncbi:unnamed protein product [Litomosoides sigmodontis]|uniref:PX domain-containing protein n=1 Tax=Litomosoides sigmodontis TaxID=42156 RepID=A0A3P6RWE9_LITSI|nr:unnamed protein product [Litomosoides sigmodontis]